jgi:hypothetical protein
VRGQKVAEWRALAASAVPGRDYPEYIKTRMETLEIELWVKP